MAEEFYKKSTTRPEDSRHPGGRYLQRTLNASPTSISRLVSVVAVAGLSESEVLALAASVARGLEPSLAAAILASARGDIEAGVVEQIPQTHRAGAIASINGQTVIVGESGLFAHLGVSLENVGDWPDRSQRQNQRILFVAVNGQTTGFLGTYGSREVIL